MAQQVVEAHVLDVADHGEEHDECIYVCVAHVFDRLRRMAGGHRVEAGRWRTSPGHATTATTAAAQSPIVVVRRRVRMRFVHPHKPQTASALDRSIPSRIFQVFHFISTMIAMILVILYQPCVLGFSLSKVLYLDLLAQH